MTQRKSLGLKKVAEATTVSGVVDVVFVHGLTGGSDTTWSHKESQCSWPRDLLPNDLPSARIFTYGYDADIVHFWNQASQSRIHDHANTFLTVLANLRLRTGTDHRPLIFVAHSMGGLVVEDLLLASKNSAEGHLKRVLEWTTGIAFLGTPFCGSHLAAWGSILGGFANLLKKSNVPLVEVLRPESEVLARIQHEFHSMIRDRDKTGYTPIEITCFFEDLAFPGVGFIVPKHSAILQGRTPCGIHANHVDMTKFSENEDAGYQAILGELWRWSPNADQAAQHSAASFQTPGDDGESSGEHPQRLLTEGQSTFNSVGNTFQGSTSDTGKVFQGTFLQSQGDMRF